MIGTAMGLLALIMIPLGFALAWWLVRSLDAAAPSRRQHNAPTPRPDDPTSTPRRPHPSTLPAVPLDDAPDHVIAAVAQRVATGGASQRRPDDLV